MVDHDSPVVDVSTTGIPGDGRMRRLVLFRGDALMVALTELDPGASWLRSSHPEEEVVYVIQGRLEYEDGRVVTTGMLTVNLAMQDHPGRSAGEGVTVLLEVYAPPPPTQGDASE